LRKLRRISKGGPAGSPFFLVADGLSAALVPIHIFDATDFERLERFVDELRTPVDHLMTNTAVTGANSSAKSAEWKRDDSTMVKVGD
jgi:hypothetical protein